MLDHESLRYVFGLKLRHLRKSRGLALKDLAQSSGLSISYINEIEKGKKYPKTQKILVLAEALGVSYDHLISLRLDKELEVFTEVIKHNLIKGIPFEFLGIPTGSVLELFGEHPDKLKALLGTFFELQRSYNISVEEIFSAVLRAFVDAQKYYFPDFEKAADQFLAKAQFLTPGKDITQGLAKTLETDYRYDVQFIDFQKHAPDLAGLQFVYNNDKKKLLLINNSLSEPWKNYLLAKEIGYSTLKLDERVTASFPLEIDSFEKLFNHFKAAYFAGALLVPSDSLKKELEEFLANDEWREKQFMKLLQSFSVPARVVLHRMIQILPSRFDLGRIFLLEINCGAQGQLDLSQQLHLTERHAPYRLHSKENYCRRWVAINIHKTLKTEQSRLAVAAQRSYFSHDDKEYLCFTVAFPAEPSQVETTSVTIGFLLDETTKKHFKFWNDPKIPKKEVSHSCERCTISDCQERASPPSLVEKVAWETKVKLATMAFIEQHQNKKT